MNIYQKMLEASKRISNVSKNLEVGYGKSKYKAVGEADVLAAVKPIEEQLLIYSYPYKRTIIDSGEMVNQTTDFQTGNVTEKKQLYLRIETIYRFINVEKPDEFIDITTYGDGVDPQDKAPGKAMTYGDKYALLKAYKIMTGDDPDQQASGELQSKTSRPAQRQQRQAPPTTNFQQPVTNPQPAPAPRPAAPAPEPVQQKMDLHPSDPKRDARIRAFKSLLKDNGIEEAYILKICKAQAIEDIADGNRAWCEANIANLKEMQKTWKIRQNSAM